MGFRYRKSIKLSPGLRLNLSKSGVGFSAGVKGARVSVGPRGTKFTASVPGTGISYQKTLSSGSKNKTSAYNSISEHLPYDSDLAVMKISDQLSGFHRTCVEDISWQILDPKVITESRYLAESKIWKKIEEKSESKFSNFFKISKGFWKRCYERELINARSIDVKNFHQSLKLAMLSHKVVNFAPRAYNDVLEEFYSEVVSLYDITLTMINPKVIKVSSNLKGQDEVVPLGADYINKRGGVSTKKLGKQKRNEIYKNFSCSSAVKISRDILAMLPVDKVYLSMNQSGIDPATGLMGVNSIISVVFRRQDFLNKNFESIDCFFFLSSLRSNINYSDRMGFRKVDRLEPDNEKFEHNENYTHLSVPTETISGEGHSFEEKIREKDWNSQFGSKNNREVIPFSGWRLFYALCLLLFGLVTGFLAMCVVGLILDSSVKGFELVGFVTVLCGIFSLPTWYFYRMYRKTLLN